MISLKNKRAICSRINPRVVNMLRQYIGITLLLFGIGLPTTTALAQQPATVAPNPDTLRIIEIVQGKSLRQDQIDSVTLIETIAGNVILKEGKTTFICDSAVINRRTNIMEAFGNIHINENDSIHTYSQYLKYVGADRIAYLKKKVQLTDKKGILYTEDLEYDMRTHIGKYRNGGKVVNANTVLRSTDGVYYADTKDVFFKKNVHLIDPKYDITTDSLRYNTQTQVATFIAPTHIVSKDGIIDTRSGTYNLKTGEAIFLDQTSFRDSTHFLSAKRMAYDEKTGVLQMENMAKLVDSANKVTTLGNTIFLNKKDNSFLAYGKPVMIFYENNDSTYIAADTLFSGLRTLDSLERKAKIEKKKVDTVTRVNMQTDTAIRYFLAFHHVRIFNDSLQSVADSLYYSTEDSVFRLFQEPVVWNDKTQVTGDTIYLFTKNKKPERVSVFNNGLIINKANEQMYNQIGGRTLNGYFKNGELEYMRVKGSPAESIFYPQDDDSAYIGMNRSSGDVIDIYFAKKELNKVKFVNDVNGILYPIRQIPEDQKSLRGFAWLDKRRPKTHLELFE
jgi:lipopolysaccharide export system protein LptA